MLLTRLSQGADGIFGHLTFDNPIINFLTLEHSYENPLNVFNPKIPEGTYTCRRGVHILDGMTNPIETFEITDVPGHTNILFHVGNFNEDSSGCVLLGDTIQLRGKNRMLTQSRISFNAFMKYLKGVNQFKLDIINNYAG